MKGLLIDGIAKVALNSAEQGGIWTGVSINGMDIQDLITSKMAEKEAETSLCRITISLEPFNEQMNINGVKVAVEL
jgi:hypothetical protein